MEWLCLTLIEIILRLKTDSIQNWLLSHCFWNSIKPQKWVKWIKSPHKYIFNLSTRLCALGDGRWEDERTLDCFSDKQRVTVNQNCFFLPLIYVFIRLFVCLFIYWPYPYVVLLNTLSSMFDILLFIHIWIQRDKLASSGKKNI